jgi:Putative beta-barrel porin 2
MQEDLSTSQMEVFIPSGAESKGNLPDPFKYDNIVVRPHFDYSLQYATGVQSAPGNSQGTIVNELTPGVKVDLGKYWSVDFSPTLRYYSSSQLQDEFDYTAGLVGHTRFGDWDLGLSQNVSSSSAPISETGAQTDENNYSTALTASYIFNETMSLDSSVSQNLDYVTDPYGATANTNAAQGTRTWSVKESLNYQLWPRLTLSLVPSGGYIGSDTVANQTFEDVEARVRWRATDKISLDLSGGFNDQQFLAAGYRDSINPVFSASIQYQPFQVTDITLTASRTVSASSYYIFAQASENTMVSLGLNQRLFKKFHANLTFTYTSEDYTESIGPFSGKRTDNMYSFSARLSHPLTQRGTWSLIYQYSENESTLGGLGYNNSMVGTEFNYTY